MTPEPSLCLILRELQDLNTMLLGKDSVVKGLQDQIGSFLERNLNSVQVEKLSFCPFKIIKEPLF